MLRTCLRTLFGGLFFTTFLLGNSASQAISQEETDRAPRPAKIYMVAEQPTDSHVSQPIVVEPLQSAVLTMLEGGILEELPVKEGTVVKKGDLIARVDTRILENNLLQAQSQLAQAQVEFDRAKILLKQENISKSVYDQRSTEFELAELNVEAAAKRLGDATLLAPFDGVIALVDVDQYQTVDARQEIVTIQSETLFVAVMHVPASQLVGSSEVDVVDSTINLDVAPLVDIEANFRSLALQADPATQTYQAELSFVRPEGLVVLPGMTGQVFATVRPDLPEGYTPPVEIPMTAIQYDGRQTFVWLVQGQGDDLTVTRRDIVVGEDIGGLLPVTEGLEAGEEIVSAGASYLFEGMRIRRFGG